MGASSNEEIRPQPGPQERFLASTADIVIYGGSAGGGKTYGLLLEALRHVNNPQFGAVIFRRESTQITNEGGLWDTAMEIYPLLGAVPRGAPKPTFMFPTGSRISFGHLNMEVSVLDWQGSQIPLIMWDELTHFEKSQFFYMLSRNRSTCGVRPYMRATCNPDADSWVAELVAWWIDQDTGYPIPERSGVLRWFVRLDDSIHWADSAAELAAAHGCDVSDAKSVTFIAASVYDNRKLLDKDPGYLANLKALSRVERERLLGGNWKVRPAAGMYFLRQDATIIESPPPDTAVPRWVRAWDLAATEPSEDNPNPDWTCGVLMGRRRDTGKIVIADVIRVRRRAADVRTLVQRTAQHDGKDVRITLPEDPGQAGKDQAATYLGLLMGWPVFAHRVTGDKVLRAEPFAAAWQAGQVEILAGPWNDAFFAELEAFPQGGHDDQVDAAADAFRNLPQLGPPDVAHGAPLESMGAFESVDDSHIPEFMRGY